MSPSTSRAAVLRGVLVGAGSALMTAAAHAAAGAGVQGTPLLLLLLVCAAVGAAVASVSVERYALTVAMLTAALASAQGIGHMTLAATAHHGPHGAMPSALMLGAHASATMVLAVLIALTEYLYRVSGSVLCWLRLVTVYRGTPRVPAYRGFTVVLRRPVLLRSGLGMRAPPRAVTSGV